MATINRISVISGVLGTALALQATSALAGWQLYPGSLCTRMENGYPDHPYRPNGMLINRSDYEILVTCPILHQNFNPDHGNNIDYVQMIVLDQAPFHNVECTLSAVYQDVDKTVRYTLKHFETSGNSKVRAHLWSDVSTANPRWHDLHYFIDCKIPGMPALYEESGIVSYEVHD